MPLNLSQTDSVMLYQSRHAMTKILLASVVGFCVLAKIYAGPIVETPLGSYEGWERNSRSGRVYQAWTKIPFAQPPVGKLRFKAPLPINKHEGVMNATESIKQCIQPGGGVEDCLQLNVFRPKVPLKNMPVLVYVHGGAFVSGNPGVRESADYLMDEDVILVQITYRLNGFGFLSLGDKVIPGNYGLKDQAMALMWVNQNIASFGGDPRKVTVFGGSAGGASTHFLLKSPVTKHLVSQAVSHSGTINHVWSTVKTADVKNATMDVVQRVKCMRTTSEEILECLQGVDSKILMAAIQSFSPMGVTLVFAPVIEPKDAENAFATEDLSLRPTKKPWIATFSNGEFQLFLGMVSRSQKAMDDIKAHLSDYLSEFILEHKNSTAHLQEKIQTLKNVYYSSSENFTLQYSKMFMDNSFVFPALYNMLHHKGPKWMFRMEYKGQLSSIIDRATGRQSIYPVAGHSDEKLYYFNLRSSYPGAGPERPADYAVSKRLIKYLVNFAKYGNPTPPGSGSKWPQFRKTEMLRITADGDILSDMPTFGQLVKVFNIWSYTIGWK